MIIKLLGKRLEPSTSVKYVGIHIDHNLSWDCHIKEMNSKLSRTNEILSKLRHYVPKKTMLSVYYAIFYSHMTYGSLVWSITSQKNLDRIFVTKKSIRIINFATFNHHTNPLFLEDNNKTLPRQLENLMKHTANIHNHFTCTSSNSGLFILQISSTSFGSYSLKYMAPYV